MLLSSKARPKSWFLALTLLSSTRRTFSLKVAIITGTSRTSGPPRPILGPRVSSFMQRLLQRRGNEVSVVDPLELQLPLLEKPHFAYAKSQVPELLQDVFETLNDAEAYVTITPEYNHAPSPALLNVLNHFGSSTFSFKPSAIISYSAGQWGGTRAAHSLRAVLSELGCIPVSAMVHIPHAMHVLDEDGQVLAQGEEDRWNSYVDRSLFQLEWWGEAAKSHRDKVDPFRESPAFATTPSQRNAPR